MGWDGRRRNESTAVLEESGGVSVTDHRAECRWVSVGEVEEELADSVGGVGEYDGGEESDEVSNEVRSAVEGNCSIAESTPCQYEDDESGRKVLTDRQG